MRVGRAHRRRGTTAGPATLVVGLVAAVTVACGHAPTTVPDLAAAPADLLLDPSTLPVGFTATELSVPQLVDANSTQLQASDATEITPPQCRPTADAKLNPTLTEANSAVLAAQASFGGLVELVTTQMRDIGADVAAMTGACARTQTMITTGNLAGTSIVTEHSEMATPELGKDAEKVEQMLLVKSATTTTLADRSVRTRIDYVGYAIVARPGGAAPVSVSLTVSGDPTDAVAPPAAPPAAQPPLAEQDFVTLFGSALSVAAAGRKS
ncbi:hypothetical protein [Gordonia polyisoprenivorans]|uniref:hypothetical protein n=1 Tax=Gordonia polyisoprenivorans TaxID=84595 RepID=UPI000B99F352|nr:hypothetical protein [Gordonia polyisoprenivorans]OZC33842.1 hypothetical protein CJJ17_21865 [Gordonia polyisoprenivorans]